MNSQIEELKQKLEGIGFVYSKIDASYTSDKNIHVKLANIIIISRFPTRNTLVVKDIADFDSILKAIKILEGWE